MCVPHTHWTSKSKFSFVFGTSEIISKIYGQREATVKCNRSFLAWILDQNNEMAP